MFTVTLVGCGFVADFYMRCLAAHPQVRVAGAYDRDPGRLAAFCRHWGVAPLPDLDAVAAATPADGLVLNLTNPSSHFAVNSALLRAGRHVYSEKPLATTMEDARALADLARANGLRLAAAPCNHLGETAQMLRAGVEQKVVGAVRLAYAEMDDGYIHRAPHEKWHSESGAPWPAQDEFRTGCTLEHAGYHLGWLVSTFGPVRTVTAASARLAGGADHAPDFACGVLTFADGAVARLTLSILAPHDHSVVLVGEEGTIAVDQTWTNTAKVWVRRRRAIRRKLLEGFPARRLRPAQRPPSRAPKGPRMDFALGPLELLHAIAEGRESRMPADLALHITEVTLALQNAGEAAGAQAMTTTVQPIPPLPWATPARL